MKKYSIALLHLLALQQVFGQALTLTPPGPNIDACGYVPSVTVTANPLGALSYEWYRNDCGQLWLATTGQTVELSTGNWYCIATWSGGSTSTSPTVTVRIPTPASCEILYCNVTSSCASTGCNLELSGPLCPNSWSNYQWTLNNNPISGATNWFYNATASGSYHCIFSNTLCSVISLDSAIIQFPCNAPANRFTSNLTSTSATLNWSTNSCAIGYKVKYRVAGTSTYTNMNVNGNVGYKNITGLIPGLQYQWRVRTKCSNNPKTWSAWSAGTSFTTPLRLADSDKETGLTIYPNPAEDILNVRDESDKQMNYLLIQNSLGQIVFGKNLFG